MWEVWEGQEQGQEQEQGILGGQGWEQRWGQGQASWEWDNLKAQYENLGIEGGTGQRQQEQQGLASLLTLLRLPAHRGDAYAKNRGVELADKAGAMGVVFLDPVSLVSPHWLLPLASTLTRYPSALVYPVVDVLVEGSGGGTGGTGGAGGGGGGVIRADAGLLMGFDWALQPRWFDPLGGGGGGTGGTGGVGTVDMSGSTRVGVTGATQGGVDRSVLNLAQKWMAGDLVFRARFRDRVPYFVELSPDPVVLTPPQASYASFGGGGGGGSVGGAHTCLSFHWYLAEVFPSLLLEAPQVLSQYADFQANVGFLTTQAELMGVLEQYKKTPARHDTGMIDKLAQVGG
ncbi:hypothetical protein B484DRAFT_389575 [Ochromonadaceae sp. CCMP2298]|nr:hypothetical protein B484DRAFT_389575 [Ochromonadaceae sp. CCMP2298]